MNWREATVEDLVEGLDIEPAMWGDEIVGRAHALGAWRTMMRSLACNSAVVETDGPKKKMVGFGFSVFVTREFAEDELGNPRPGMNSRIVASVVNGKPAMRPEAGLCETDEPLDLVVMGGHLKYDMLSPEETIQAEMILPASFGAAHLGYRLNRVFSETLTEKHQRLMESSGVWRRLVAYPEHKRALVAMTREDAFSVSGSVAGPVFSYQRPIFGLRVPEKQLIAEALKGGTDNEIAARMNLSLAAVKKRWASLFEKVAEVRPDLLPDAEMRESAESRGPQKRHHILAYVRSHPEEVRPYRWRPNAG